MKWVLSLLAIVILVAATLGFIGSKVIALPKGKGPFPPAIQAQIDTLDDKRREIEWLVAKSRLTGEANQLRQERQDYEELANEANAWIKAAENGLEANNIDTALLTAQFEQDLMPKAKALNGRLQLRMQWMKWELFKTGLLQAGAAEVNHIISNLDNGWRRLKTYVELTRADDAESRKIVKNQLDEMEWLPWSELMAEQI